MVDRYLRSRTRAVSLHDCLVLHVLVRERVSRSDIATESFVRVLGLFAMPANSVAAAKSCIASHVSHFAYLACTLQLLWHHHGRPADLGILHRLTAECGRDAEIFARSIQCWGPLLCQWSTGATALETVHWAWTLGEYFVEMAQDGNMTLRKLAIAFLHRAGVRDVAIARAVLTSNEQGRRPDLRVDYPERISAFAREMPVACREAYLALCHDEGVWQATWSKLAPTLGLS